jgi:hypothetical protein
VCLSREGVGGNSDGGETRQGAYMIVQSKREVRDPLVPFTRDESESKEFVLILLSIELVPFLIPRVKVMWGKIMRPMRGSGRMLRTALARSGRPGRLSMRR